MSEVSSLFSFAIRALVAVICAPFRAAWWVLWNLLDMVLGIGDEAYD
jgi:hypothetical protein